MESTNYINSVNLNQNTDFPYLVLNVINGNSYPKNPGFRVMHWHEDIQFIYVLDDNVGRYNNPQNRYHRRDIDIDNTRSVTVDNSNIFRFRL